MSTHKNNITPDSAVPEILGGRSRLVGAKQIRRALRAGNVQKVFLAQNADPIITQPLVAECQLNNVEYAWVRSMVDLGKACGIEVGTAAAAIVI